MTKDELHKKIVAVFAKTFDLPEENITDEIAYNEHEKWDSLGHLELVSNLEEAFGISFSMDDVQKMSSIAICEEIVQNYLAK